MSVTTWETKRRGLRSVLTCAGEVYRLGFLNWTMLGSSWFLGLLGTAVGIATYFLMAHYVGGGPAALLSAYGGNFAAYIVLGMILSAFLGVSLGMFQRTLCDGYWSAQFEMFNTQPGGVVGYFLGCLARLYSFEVINAAINLLIGIGLFGLRLRTGALLPGLAVVLLAAVAVSGLGMVAACGFVFLGTKQWGDPISWLLGLAGSLLAGVYFPVTLLPAWCQRLAAFLPQTYAFDAARRILLGGASWADPQVRLDVSVLVAVAAVGVPIGAALLAGSIRVGERTGAFTRWN